LGKALNDLGFKQQKENVEAENIMRFRVESWVI
jgi:hypothetical protein